MKALKFIAVGVMLLVATMVSAQVKFETRPYETSTFLATFPVADGDPVTLLGDATIKVPIFGTDKEGAVHIYSLQLKNEAIYQVSFQEFPKGFTTTLDKMLNASSAEGEKYAHVVSEEKADAQVGSLPGRQVISHSRGIAGSPVQGDFYGWQRFAVVPTGIWSLMVACPEKAGCTTTDAMTFLNSVVIKNVATSQPAQPGQPNVQAAPQPTQPPADPRKKIFLEFTMHTNNVAAMLIPGVDPGSDDANSERVVSAATKEFIKSCPTVLITTDQAAADFTLIMHGGNSTLYNKEKSAVFVSTARWKMSNLVKDVCTYASTPIVAAGK